MILFEDQLNRLKRYLQDRFAVNTYHQPSISLEFVKTLVAVVLLLQTVLDFLATSQNGSPLSSRKKEIDLKQKNNILSSVLFYTKTDF